MSAIESEDFIDPYPDDADDPAVREEQRHAAHVYAIRRIMAERWGRHFVRTIIDRMQINQRGLLTDFGQGRRDAGLEIAQDIAQIAPDLWAVSERERLDVS